MKFDILTIFPEQVLDFTKYSILRIAQEKKLVEVNVHNLRDWADDKHNTVDDIPYGGGPGMVMKVEPVFRAIKELKKDNSIVIATTPKGKTLTQGIVKKMASNKDSHYIILAGHYEGFDQRIMDYLVDVELSIGNYILSGGEIASLVIVDSITRLLPGVLGNPDSLESETFEGDDVDYPSYTRPAQFNGWEVPDVLKSGNHANISQWRKKEAKRLSDKAL